MANAATLIEKAERAAQSATLLPESGDVDGACNRAYYAMFDAARAALIVAIGISQESVRTHSGLINAFGLHLVKSGRVDPSLGRALNRAHKNRLIADYTGDVVELQQATWVVDVAAVFVDAMRRFMASQA